MLWSVTPTGTAASARPAIAFERSGEGPPLLLIHANGMSRAAWKPVLPMLRREREVIVIDLPGHGDSPPVPSHISPAPPGIAVLLAELLDALGVERAHVAGNSLGGWTALELARRGRALSVVALGPAGLWEHGPIKPVIALSLAHRGARRWPALARRAVRTRAGRQVLFRHFIGDPGRVPPDDAATLVEALGRASGFHALLVGTHMGRFAGGRGIEVPVSVVFGQCDRTVPASARRRDELPAHTRWHEPPRLGHVPMWDDPELVAQLILGAPTPASRSARRS
jgi:pimeloyl-ACP methyl ester carboxylesterase